VTVLDDDATVTVSPARAFVGTSSNNPQQRVGSFTHVLDSQPTGTVSAMVTSRNSNLVRPLIASYTFNTSSTDPSLGWNVPRTVNLASFTRGASGSTTIVITYSGGGYDGVTVEVPVTVVNQSPASIPDANLRAGLAIALGKSATASILPAELATLTSLSIRNQTITDLRGLEHATSLTELNLGGNGSLANLSPLSGLTSLQRLNLNGSDVSNLMPLSGLPNLRRLELVNANVTNVGPLSGVTSLRELFLRNNAGVR